MEASHGDRLSLLVFKKNILKNLAEAERREASSPSLADGERRRVVRYIGGKRRRVQGERERRRRSLLA